MLNALPPVASLQRGGPRNICLTLLIDTRLPVFGGHFDGRPVLPGVTQIDWAARFARCHLGRERVFSGMRRLKFLRVIQPPTTVRLELDWRDEALLQFDYQALETGASFSRGSLCFV